MKDKHRIHDRKRYQVIFYSNETKEQPKNFSITKVRFVLYSSLFLVLMIFVISLVVVYSPWIRFVTLNNSDMQRMSVIEEKMKKILSEMTKLEEYNNQLRYALGDTTKLDNSKTNGFSLSNEFISNESNDKGLFRSSLMYSKNSGSLNIPIVPPVSNYIISQEYDEENSHYGLDFAGKVGEQIVAAADGYVIFSNWTLDYGNIIIIQHGGNFLTKYKHNLCNLKQVGNYVRRGEIIALLGNTGKLSSNPHLHFEIWKNGIARNPLQYLLLRK